MVGEEYVSFRALYDCFLLHLELTILSSVKTDSILHIKEPKTGFSSVVSVCKKNKHRKTTLIIEKINLILHLIIVNI